MFQRMVAVPYEQYAQLNTAQGLRDVKQPLDGQFSALDKQYTDRVNVADPYRRMMLQGETLEEMKAMKERMRNVIVANSPKPYRNRAKALFDGLESIIKFNERGEILSDEGRAVPHSHVQDLIQYAVRDRRREVLPTGWKDFLSLMKKHNVPRHMLNRFTLDEMEGNMPAKHPFVFGTPAARQVDRSGTIVKRPATKRKLEENPFDAIIANPTPKKRKKLRQLPVRERRVPDWLHSHLTKF